MAQSETEREICESADVVARIVRNRHAVTEVARRLEIGAAPLVVLCGRGSSGHVGVFLRHLIETRLHLPVSASRVVKKFEWWTNL
jgi:glutamine---fructose-6-phosphate transaminase (isomerizing)